MAKKRRKIKVSRILMVAAAGAVLLTGLGLGVSAAAGALFKKPEANTQTASVNPSSLYDKLSSLKQSIASDISVSTSLAAQTPEVEQQSQELDDLRDQINAYLTSKNVDASKISWAVQDLTTDAYIESDNAKTNFTAASTYKLPLCMIYYEKIAEGSIKADDTLEYTAEMTEQEDDENLTQPIHRKYKVGDKIQIDELLQSALYYSDNIAGHMLYENLGGYEAFKTIALKYSPTAQNEQFTSESYNYFNAHYMMELLHYLYNTTGTFNDLKYWLTYASEDIFLNKNLNDTYVQKLGNLSSVRNAVGYNPGYAPFSLSIFSNISKEEGETIIGDLGELVFNYFNQKYFDGFYSEMDMSRVWNLNAQVSTPADVVNNRAGLNGQTLPELTAEDIEKFKEQITSD